MASITDDIERLPLQLHLGLLAALLAADLLLIALHIGFGLGMETIPAAFNIARDGSLAELLGYAKWLAIALLLAQAWRRSGIPLLLALACAFLLALADDSLQMHERLGAWLAAALALPAWADLRPQDLGELAAFAAMGLALLLVLVPAALRTARADWPLALPTLALIAALATVGVGVDFLHNLAAGLPYGAQALDLVEDGGEMMLASAALAHAALLPRLAGAGRG